MEKLKQLYNKKKKKLAKKKINNKFKRMINLYFIFKKTKFKEEFIIKEFSTELGRCTSKNSNNMI